MSEPKNKRAKVVSTEHESMVDAMAEYVLYVMSQATTKKKDSGLWDRLPPCLKKDKRVAKAAMVQSLCCGYAELPIEYQTDETFLLECVKQQPKCWLSLPDPFKNDIRFAMAIEFSASMGISTIEDVLQRFPNSRDLWKKLINSTGFFRHLVRAIIAGTTIRSDRELMLHACTRDPCCLRNVHASLQADKGFLDLLLQEEPMALTYLSQETQRQFPELLTDHFRPMFQCLVGTTFPTHGTVFAGIFPEFWHDREHVLSWFRAGGDLSYEMPRDWRKDREILLLVAENNPETLNSLSHTSITLLADKEFALRVLELRPTLFFQLPYLVMGDLDVALLGCTGFTDFRSRCKDRERRESDFPRNLGAATAERVKALVATHKSMDTLLLGMSDDSSGCLSMLDLGHETSLSFKKRIADFAGIPVGRKLRHVRKAARHLGVEYS